MITYWNKAAERLFGWTAPEVIGKPAQDILQTVIPNSSRDEAIAKMLADNGYAGEGSYRHKDGHYLLTEVGCTVLRGSKGEFKGTITTFRDITERKRAEEEVREARELAEKIIDTVREPMLVLDVDLQVQSANDSFYGHFQVEPSETVGRLVYELGNGQWNIPALRELLENVLPENKVFNDFEVRHDFENLGKHVMFLNARRIDHVQLILLAIENITERKQAEEMLRESEARFRTLTDAVPQVIWTNNADGKAIYFNQRWYEYSGLSYEASAGPGWQVIVHPDDAPASVEQWQRALAKGEVFDTEYLYAGLMGYIAGTWGATCRCTMRAVTLAAGSARPPILRT